MHQDAHEFLNFLLNNTAESLQKERKEYLKYIEEHGDIQVRTEPKPAESSQLPLLSPTTTPALSTSQKSTSLPGIAKSSSIDVFSFAYMMTTKQNDDSSRTTSHSSPKGEENNALSRNTRRNFRPSHL